MERVRTGHGVLALVAGVLAVAGLVFVDIAPFVADYVVIAMGLVGLIAAIAQRDAVLRARGNMLLALALVLLLLTLPFVYRGSQDLLPVLALLPLLLVPGVAYLVSRNAQLLLPFALPLLCLFGAVAAFAVGWSEYATVGGRVGGGNNPIHYGGMAVLLGFMALTGVCVGRSPWRLLFLAGPVAGIAAAVLSGSRGPLLGGMAMAVAAMPMLIFWYRRDWQLLLAVVVLVLGVPALALMFGPSMRALTAFTDVAQVVSSTAPLQTADVYRVAMYQSAWQQFLASPIYGQGFGQVMAFTRAAFPELPELATLEHLHSDIADFVALGGLLGLAAYGLIIAAPLTNLRFQGGPTSRVVALGSAVLSAGFLSLGMTNAMFGVLPQTVLFVTILGYLIALKRAPGVPVTVA